MAAAGGQDGTIHNLRDILDRLELLLVRRTQSSSASGAALCAGTDENQPPPPHKQCRAGDIVLDTHKTRNMQRSIALALRLRLARTAGRSAGCRRRHPPRLPRKPPLQQRRRQRFRVGASVSIVTDSQGMSKLFLAARLVSARASAQ